MLTFALGSVTVTDTGILEVLTLAQARFLAVELRDFEVSLGGEDIILLLLPMANGLVTELSHSSRAAVCHKYLGRNSSHSHLVGDGLYRCEVGVSEVHIVLSVTSPFAVITSEVCLVLDVWTSYPIVAVPGISTKSYSVWVIPLGLS